ncbi:MAG: hypothetical protein AAGG56_18705, partial [Pseudomonadota bacterium]
MANRNTVQRWLAHTSVVLSAFAIAAPLAAAEIEDSLVIRTDADDEVMSYLVEVFEEKYPGVNVSYTTMNSMESLVKSFNEMPNPQADILTTKAHLLIKGNDDSIAKSGEPMLQ